MSSRRDGFATEGAGTTGSSGGSSTPSSGWPGLPSLIAGSSSCTRTLPAVVEASV
ncbi:hypothetical protein [Kitasatospora albolonga]|uniref:hypothetical protein n=1 Tax=Kitasatospora albolonga TaxID=68173 RepID=UPI0031EDF350